MQIQRNDLNACTVEFLIESDPEEVKAGFAKAKKSLAKNLRIPGFRAGHVPPTLWDQYLDPKKVTDTAAENMVQSALKDVIAKESIQVDPFTRSMLNIEKIDEQAGEFKFQAKIPLPPKIEVGDTSKLPVTKSEVQVTDEEIEERVDAMRKRRSTREPISDRGLEPGDVAVLNVRPEGETGDGRNFMTIVGQTFPEMDALVTGMKVEEMKSAELKFPKTFQDKDWAGKKLKVTVMVNSASATKLPDLTDEFAKSLSAESLADLKERIKAMLAATKEQVSRDFMIEQALEGLLARSSVEVSDNSWEAIAQQRLQETAMEVAREQKSLEDYAKENGMTLQELIENWREKSRLYIKRAYLIREIFQLEKMEITNEELNQEVVAMASEYEMAPGDLIEAMKKNNNFEELRFRSISRKVCNFLLERADVKEEAVSAS